MALDIPLPGSFGKAFNEGSNVGSEILSRMLQAKIAQQNANTTASLAPSEMAKNEAQALQYRMLYDLLNGNAGTGKPGEKMTVNQALLASGLAKIPVQNIEGKTYTGFGTYDTGQSPEEKANTTAKGEAQKKVLVDTAEAAPANAALHNSYNALNQIFQNPRYKEIAGSFESWTQRLKPFGIPIGAVFQKMNPEDAKLLTAADTHMGNIVSAIAAKFKGPFKDMVNGIVNNMKPNPSESYEAQQSKLNQLMQLANITDSQAARFEQLVGGGVQPQTAMNQAMQESQQAQQTARSKVTPKVIDKKTEAALKLFPQDIQKEARDAIRRGANPEAVLNDAAKLLNVTMK